MIKYIIIFFSLLALQTCKNTKANHDKPQMKSQQINLEGAWHVISLQGIDSISKKPTLIFNTENNTISGNAGCNSYGGSFIIDGNKITIKKGFSTKMYCSNMNIENAFFENLKKITTYTIENDTLLLLSDKNKTQIILEKKIN